MPEAKIRTADADKIDAIRLCKYAFKESDELKMSKPLNPKLMQLKDLQTSRTGLLSQKNANKTYLKELNNINDKVRLFPDQMKKEYPSDLIIIRDDKSREFEFSFRDVNDNVYCQTA